MKTLKDHETQSGFAHLGIILAVVGVLVVGGLVAWRYMGVNKPASGSVSSKLSKQLANAKCEYDDKDLCKFFVSWKEHDSYKMVMSLTPKAGEKSTSIYEIDGDNTHMTTTGQYASEIITIGKLTTYTKAADGTWWKQTAQDTASNPDKPVASDTAVDFEEPSKETETNKTEYKALGKEACGSLTCFKYQVIHAEDPATTEYLWFDTKSYQIRRTTSQDSDNSTETVFSYDNVTVKAPANFKELAPNQYLMPGSNEPATVPSYGTDTQ